MTSARQKLWINDCTDGVSARRRSDRTPKTCLGTTGAVASAQRISSILLPRAVLVFAELYSAGLDLQVKISMVNVALSKSISISATLQGARCERAAHEKRFRGSNHISLGRRRVSHLRQTTKQEMELSVGASLVRCQRTGRATPQPDPRHCRHPRHGA